MRTGFFILLMMNSIQYSIPKIFLITIFIFSHALGQPMSKSPAWAKGIVWYQIFPERFANGDLSNDPKPEKVFINQQKFPEGWEVTPWTSNWFEASGWEKKLGGSVRDHLFSRRYGGDIQGIIDRLDYIKTLGVGGIYLNPVFEAVSMHKYDASMYHHIDLNFGPDPEGDLKIISQENPSDPTTWKWTSADKLFLKLVKEIHKRGMKIIIDGVFNHTGIQFWAFQDIIKKKENSVYKDWYIIKDFYANNTHAGLDYKGWWDIKSLPEFNRTKEDLQVDVKNHILQITKRWMDPNDDGDCIDGIDGWRLDVARDVPLGFWRDWNNLVKSTNPEALIIGELWELSADFISHEGVFDALMNYNFAFAVHKYFINNEIDTKEFIKQLKEIDKTYPDENMDLLQNLLGSHDIERLVSLIQNPGRNFDRYGDEKNIEYDPAKPTREVYQKSKLIVAFQMLYRGAPMIYYGDEIGMWGADDPHCRKPMVWDDLKYDDEIIDEASGFAKGRGKYSVEPNIELLNFYKEIIALRNSNEVLKLGKVEFLENMSDEKSFAFLRVARDSKILVVFNLSNQLVQMKTGFEQDEMGVLYSLNNAKINFKESSLEISANSFAVISVK